MTNLGIARLMLMTAVQDEYLAATALTRAQRKVAEARARVADKEAEARAYEALLVAQVAP